MLVFAGVGILGLIAGFAFGPAALGLITAI
jgi:hypothetical protein